MIERLCHKSTEPAPDFKQPVGRKYAYCLTQGCTAYAELCGKLVFVGELFTVFVDMLLKYHLLQRFGSSLRQVFFCITVPDLLLEIYILILQHPRKKKQPNLLALENSYKRRYNFIRFISSEEKLWIYEAKNVTQGVERAPNRSLFYAMGYTKEELERPLIGVVSAHSEIVPGHFHLDKLTEAVKAGVRMAGGTPIMIPSIGVCDGIAMGHIGMKYSLPSRELIADSVETMAMAHGFDGLVLVPNCDKIVPGMLLGALRINIPTVVCSGGPMMSGLVDGVETSLSKMFEAVGACKAGIIDEEKAL